MKKRIHLIFVFSFLRAFGHAQTTPEPSQIKLKEIVPSTPNAAAIGRFGDVPVGNYTGIPSIAIPLYSLKIKEFELPIALAYHAGGVKVEDIASDVGLGWSLNAGGAISVTVNGLQDWAYNGFINLNGDPYKTLPDEPFTPVHDPNATDVPGGKLYQLAKNLAEGVCDGEPDLYFFNFCGRSGQFFFDQYRQLHTIPVSNLKIQGAETGAFVIIDENGVKYNFTDVESTQMQSTCGLQQPNGSWMLSRIDLPDKNYIQFNYSTLNYTYRINTTQARNVLIPGNYGPGILECSDVNSLVNCTGKKLTSITSSVGHNVVFTYSTIDRADLPGTKGLSKVSVYYKGRLLNEHVLTQSYFNGTQLPAYADYCRLKLERLTDLSGAIHKFDYDTSRQLPNRLSCEQDHWGFWNGKINNTTLLPIDIDHGFRTGADRDIDTSYAKIGVLRRITYPTGGYTDLEYEPNDYYFTGNRYTYQFRDQQLYPSGAIGQTVTKTFVIPAAPMEAVSFVAYYDAGSGSILEPEPENPPLTITLSGPGGYYRTFYNSTPAQGLGITNLAPGTYTMSITTNENYSGGYLRITYYEKTTTAVSENALAGGLRIKRTTDYSLMNGAPIVKRYIYRQFSDTTRSSGRINYQPVYTAGYTHTSYTASISRRANSQTSFSATPFSYADYWKQSASSVMPLGSINGGSVAYTNVTVLSGESGESGKSEYEYSFAPRNSINQWHPLVPSESRDWQNGLLLKRRDYKKEAAGSFALLKSLTNYYSIRQDSEYWNFLYTPASYKTNEYVRGWGIRIVYKHVEINNGGIGFIPAEFMFNDYHHTSKWQRLDSAITLTYGDNGIYQTTKQVNYYDNPAHMLPSRILSENSKGQSHLTEIHRPQDAIAGLSASARQGKDTLAARHIISPVLEHIVTTNGAHTQSIRTDYKYWSNGLSLPEYLAERRFADNYSNRLQFSNYDGTANLVQQANLNDIPETYIWGYGNTVPVARIVGAVDYNTIYGLVSQVIIQDSTTTDQAMRAELNKIRINAATAGALVTTYTYQQGVGISSETDPKGYTTYFEYDVAGRLVLIKDKDGKILKQYDYQYQKPLTQ